MEGLIKITVYSIILIQGLHIRYLLTTRHIYYQQCHRNYNLQLQPATDYDEFKDIIANKPGFVKAMWCGDQACEDKIKEDTTATSRCMPFNQEHLSDVCVCCGKPAKAMVYWGKAY